MKYIKLFESNNNLIQYTKNFDQENINQSYIKWNNKEINILDISDSEIVSLNDEIQYADSNIIDNNKYISITRDYEKFMKAFINNNYYYLAKLEDDYYFLCHYNNQTYTKFAYLCDSKDSLIQLIDTIKNFLPMEKFINKTLNIK